MPYFAFTNDLISQILVDHFRAGIPLGTLARRAGVKKAALKKMAHRVADLLESGVARLVEEITRPVKGGERVDESRALLLVQVEGAVGHPAYQVVASVRLKVPQLSHDEQFTIDSVTPPLLLHQWGLTRMPLT